MILTAIVQTKDGTLVVDLPRDRIDLEMKIRSVGIERLSDQIHIIDDEEKSDISVKLFGESDIGRHLSLLFNENHGETLVIQAIISGMTTICPEPARALSTQFAAYQMTARGLSQGMTQAALERNAGITPRQMSSTSKPSTGTRHMSFLRVTRT